MSTHESNLLWRLAVTLAVLIIGGPAAVLLAVGTQGLILVPLVVAYYVLPLIALNYVIWGWAFNRWPRDDGVASPRS